MNKPKQLSKSFWIQHYAYFFFQSKTLLQYRIQLERPQRGCRKEAYNKVTICRAKSGIIHWCPPPPPPPPIHGYMYTTLHPWHNIWTSIITLSTHSSRCSFIDTSTTIFFFQLPSKFRQQGKETCRLSLQSIAGSHRMDFLKPNGIQIDKQRKNASFSSSIF